MSSVIPPTKKQKEVFDYISRYIKENGYSPTYREIEKALGYSSTASVVLHIDSLIKRGHLRRRENQARSLEVVDSVPGEEQALVEKVRKAFDEVERPVSKDEFRKLTAMVDGLEAFGLEEQAAEFSNKLRALIQDVL